LLFIFLTINTFGKIIWEEKFAVPEKGVWGDSDGQSVHIDLSTIEQWSINYDSCHFAEADDYVKTVSTSGGRFEARDCDGDAIWSSRWIDIRRYQQVNCELTARETGSGTKPEKKYLKAYFQVGNQEPKPFESNGINEGNWSVVTASQPKVNGDSLRIVVHMNSSYANDKVILDDIRVWTDQPEIVDKSQLAEVGDVLINEVLFDPYPGGTDFVELYNRSEKSIRLDHLHLANRDENADLKTIVPITSNELLFKPKSYLVLCEDAEKVLVFYDTSCPDCFMDVDDLPAYNNNSGDVVLLDDSMDVIDEMRYSSKMHDPLLVDDEGVSLERISFNDPALDPANWASARGSAHFATPGDQNSMAGTKVQEYNMVTIAPKSISPNGDGYHDYLSISYQFTKPNYVANLKIFDAHGAPVCDLVKNERTGTTGEWIWTGKQSNGQRCRLGMYIVMLEIRDDQGNTKRFKKAFSVTDRLQ